MTNSEPSCYAQVTKHTSVMVHYYLPCPCLDFAFSLAEMEESVFKRETGETTVKR